MYIGIDLGTSNSVIVGLSDGQPKVFRTPDNAEVLPSVIYFDKRGMKLYGRRAYDQAMLQPENVAMGFKRLMGTSTAIQISGAGMSLSPEECSAEIIKQLLSHIEGQKVTGAVITIPAAFNQLQSEATMRAAKLAGLEKVELLQEPVAAAMTAMGGSSKKSGQFLIYDLGGGTFDLALAQSLNGEISILAHQGINMLGGRDFDRMLVNEVVRPWLSEKFDLPDNFQRDAQYRKLIRVAYLAAEKAKIELSSKPEARIFASDEELRLQDASGTEIFLDVPVTRAQYDALIKEPIHQTIHTVRELLKENGYKHDDIDRLVFIGGPSRTPLIREMVAHELGIPTDMSLDPLTAVAVGAAYYAESRQWGADGDVSAKPKQASAEAPEKPQVSYDYPVRTGLDEIDVKVKVGGALGNAAQIQIDSADGWSSDFKDIADGVVVACPVKKMGENSYTIKLFDDKDRHLDAHDHTFVVTRTVATTADVKAAQSIGIKALEKLNSDKNVLQVILEKGTKLPVGGEAKFASARNIKAGAADHIAVEVYQAEFPERMELNLCVGVFRIAGTDLPDDSVLKEGDIVQFNWRMSDSGILQATVTIPDLKDGKPLELRTPRFYSPQAGQVDFEKEQGLSFARSMIQQGEEEWGDLAAALGPQGAKEIDLLKLRLTEQKEILEESAHDPEQVRKITEEVRFIRQDLARLGKKHQAVALQRQIGKLQAVFNRVARQHADDDEVKRFEKLYADAQKILDDGEEVALQDAEKNLSDMRDIFFAAAWRDVDYVHTWFVRLKDEPFLFPDQEEFKDMVMKGEKFVEQGDASSCANWCRACSISVWR